VRILVASTAFPDTPDQLRELLPGDEVIVDASVAQGTVDVVVPLMTRVDGPFMDRFAPRLIQQAGVGLEGVDRVAARERRIPVANVPAAGTGNSEGVGEIAVLHLLALSRRYHEGLQALAARRLGEPSGVALHGRTIVILGLGDVGAAVAHRLQGFDARLVGVGTREGEQARARARELGLAEYQPLARLNQALRGAHALVVCCVLNDATRGLVGREAMAALGQGDPGYLINVARGPVVDYDALLAALRDGTLAGAGLEVFWDEPVDPEDPLLRHNVTLTPHTGGSTTYSNRRVIEGVVANIERLRRGEPVVEAPS
jgi:phosphoglycerate dehydrogenase-like enzyme